MKDFLPEKLKILAKDANFPIYVVGGACRDFLSGLHSNKHDWDICAPVLAETFAEHAKKCGFVVHSVYKNTGTVKLTCDGEDYEYSSFRTDEYVRGEHNPCKIYFTDDIRLDALRRDFKCNAVYYDIYGGQFVDPLGGIPEIEGKMITTVTDPVKVFGEDGLRLMRLCRQAAQTGFTPSKECILGARENAKLICDITAERIWAELNSLLNADGKYGIVWGQYKGLRLLNEIGVLQYILPELKKGDGMEQRKDYHDHDVLEHSFRCVGYADSSVRLAALLHDVGKPICMEQSGKCAKHEEVGSIVARDICARLKVSNKLKEETERLVALHMYDFNCQTKENKVRKAIVKNFDIFDKLLLVKQADFSACKDDTSVAPSVKKWRDIYEKMKAENVPFSLKDLAVRGDELIKAGIEPRRVGHVLNALLELCVCDPSLNEHERLMKISSSVV